MSPWRSECGFHEEVSVVSVVLILWGVGQSINQSINQSEFIHDKRNISSLRR